jgi:hypothetical protein
MMGPEHTHMNSKFLEFSTAQPFVLSIAKRSRKTIEAGLSKGKRGVFQPAFRMSAVAALLLVISTNSFAATIDIFPVNSFEAAVESLNPGDTLIVHQGTYADSGRISIMVRGTASAPVVIKGADGEAVPLITRLTSASIQNTINIEGATYLTVKGLEITGNEGDGINLNSTPSYITLENLHIHDVDVGINFRSDMDHITVRRNHIHRTGIDGGTGEGMYVGCNEASCVVHSSVIENNWIHDTLPGTTQGDGIEIKVGSHSNIIRDNVIYNMSYPGIFVYGGGAGVNTVEGNIVWNCLEGIYAVADAIVRNNIVFNSGTGLSLYGHSQVSQMKNVTAVHNTLYNNNDGIYARWGGTNMILANNAIYSPGKTAVNSSSSVQGTVRSNYVEGGMSGDQIDNLKFVSGGSYASAFVDASGMNFWPKPGSPLIDAANVNFIPSLDFNGNTRTSPYDVGAYEANGLAANPGWKIVPGFKATGSQPVLPPAAPTNLQVQ